MLLGVAVALSLSMRTCANICARVLHAVSSSLVSSHMCASHFMDASRTFAGNSCAPARIRLLPIQVFETWLLEHGARFPKLTMQKYDDEVGTVVVIIAQCTVVVTNRRLELSGEECLQVGKLFGLQGERQIVRAAMRAPTHELDDRFSIPSFFTPHPPFALLPPMQVRGVHATTQIDEEEVIVEVPLNCLITVEMGKVTDVGRAVLAADLEMDAPKHVFLMLFMLVDKKNPRR